MMKRKRLQRKAGEFWKTTSLPLSYIRSSFLGRICTRSSCSYVDFPGQLGHDLGLNGICLAKYSRSIEILVSCSVLLVEGEF